MMVKDGLAQKFYNDYVTNVYEIIERNARMEFECIWKEHMAHPNKTKSLISDELSLAIINLDDELQASEVLWNNEPLRKVVLCEALPRVLIQQIGLSTILSRVPNSYLKALFSSFLASRFIYSYGVSPSQFAFFEFMTKYFSEINQIRELTQKFY